MVINLVPLLTNQNLKKVTIMTHTDTSSHYDDLCPQGSIRKEKEKLKTCYFMKRSDQNPIVAYKERCLKIRRVRSRRRRRRI